MSARVLVLSWFVALSGCGVAARVGAGIGGSNANYAPQAAATVGLAAGSSTLNILAGLTGVFGVTPRAVPVPVGHVAGLVEATYSFPGCADVAKWGIRGGRGGGPNFDGARGVGWQTFARVGPLYALTDASDYLTALGLELMIGVTGFPKAELFWGVNFNIGWFFKVIERFPTGG
jgi:hypothetical protein